MSNARISTVVITRPQARGEGMSQALVGAGFHTLSVPVIGTEVCPVGVAERAALEQLSHGGFSHIAFPSITAVQALREMQVAAGMQVRIPDGCTAVAQGDATAEETRRLFGVADPLTPSAYVAEGLLELLLTLPTRPQNVLLVASLGGRSVVRDGLSAAQVPYCWLRAYHTVLTPPTPDHEAQLLALDPLRTALTFFSPSSVRAFFQSEVARALVREGAAVVSVGPITSATLRSLQLPVSAEAGEYNAHGVIEAVTRLSSERLNRSPE